MKLKKVVSLALAGVMAVSMLAGCGTNGKTEPTEDENGVVKAGYSAEFGEIADLDLDYVTFKDSAVDQDALKAAVASCTDVQLEAALLGGNVFGNNLLQGAMLVPRDLNLRCTSVFFDNADLDYYFAKTGGASLGDAFSCTLGYWFGPDSMQNKALTTTLKAGVVAAVDGTMDPESVVAQVESLLASNLKRLPESGKNDGVIVDYTYTVSVSLVNRVVTTIDLVKADMDFVSVTVTRTGTLAA